METTISTLPIQNLFIVKGKKLVELAIESINLKKGGVIEYLDKDGNVLLTESENNIVKAYADKASFEKSICINRITPLASGKLYDVDVREFYRKVRGGSFITPTWVEDEVGIVGFTWDGTQAQESFLPLIDVNISKHLIEKKFFRAKFLKADTFCEMWETSKWCFEFHEYDVQHEDGTTEHVIGGFKALALNPKQTELVNQLKEVLAKLAEENVELISDYSSDNLYAFNNESGKYAVMNEEDIYENARRFSANFATKVGTITTWSMDYNYIVDDTTNTDD